MTIRTILSELSDCVDFDDSHYLCSSIALLFADGKKRDFAVSNDDDKRSEMDIGLGKGLSTFKHGHIKIVYCILPREAAMPEIEQYRDTRAPHMYKYHLPERVFNSILSRFPLDIESTIERCRYCYAESGYKWDGDANWRKKLHEWFGWEFN